MVHVAFLSITTQAFGTERSCVSHTDDMPRLAKFMIRDPGLSERYALAWQAEGVPAGASLMYGQFLNSILGFVTCVLR